MKRQVGAILLAGIMLGGCTLIPQRTGVEIMSYPTAKVYIGGKEAGMTPYKNNTLKPGEVEIKLVTGETSWIKKIKLENGSNTVIDRELTAEAETSGGYILYLERTGDEEKAGLMVSSSPDKAAVAIEGEIKGFTPMRLDSIGTGDKQVTISYPGYKTVNVFVKGSGGYQLVIEAELPQETVKEKIDEGVVITTPANGEETGAKVMIINTETGWLRVRSGPGNGSEIERVKPGEEYTLLEEQNGWYKIKLPTGEGWVSAKYVEKL